MKCLMVLMFLCSSCSTDKINEPNAWDLGGDLGSAKDLSSKDMSKKDSSKMDLADTRVPDVNVDSGTGNAIICGQNGEIFNPRNLESLRGCEISLTNVDITDYVKDDLVGYDALREVRASFGITRAPDLLTNGSFNNLEIVGHFSIYGAPKLRVVNFSKLSTVRKTFTLRSFPAIQVDFSSLEIVRGNFEIVLQELRSLDGFPSLTFVDGDLYINTPQITQAQFQAFIQNLTVTGSTTFIGKDTP